MALGGNGSASSPGRLAAPAAAPAMAAVAFLTLSLWSGGGDDAPAAALQSALFGAAAIWATLQAPRSAVQATLAENRLSLLALTALVLWTGITTLPMGGPLAHPAYARFELAPGAISIAPYRALEGLAAFLFPVCAFWVGALAVRRPEDKRHIARLLMTAGAIYAAFGLIAFARAYGAAAPRLDAGLVSPNAAATTLGLFLLAAAAVALRAGQRARTPLQILTLAPFAFGAMLIGSCALLLTASRGGALAFAAALLLLLALGMRACAAPSKRAHGARVAAALAACAAIAAMALLGGDVTAARLTDEASLTNDGRWSIYLAHWQAFLGRPILGHGMNTFHEVNAMIATPENAAILGFTGSTMNIILQLLVEQGLIGLFLFGILIVPIVARCASIWLRGAAGATWAALALAAFVLCLAHGMVDIGLKTPAIAALLAFMLGAFSRRNLA